MLAPPPVTIRLLSPSDSLAELTDLLHRAYARLGGMGLHCTAVDQPEETTRRRATKGAGLVAERAGRIVGTLAFHRKDPTPECAWFRRDDVVVLEELAVDPEIQEGGVGAALMDEAERRAAESGAAFAVDDTAAPAVHLVALYEARGNRIVDSVQWLAKACRSVVFAKSLVSLPAG